MVTDRDLIALQELLRNLDARITSLEKALGSGSTRSLESGTSKIVVSPARIRIETLGDISIKASGTVTLKGSKVETN